MWVWGVFSSIRSALHRCIGRSSVSSGQRRSVVVGDQRMRLFIIPLVVTIGTLKKCVLKVSDHSRVTTCCLDLRFPFLCLHLRLVCLLCLRPSRGFLPDRLVKHLPAQTAGHSPHHHRHPCCSMTSEGLTCEYQEARHWVLLSPRRGRGLEGLVGSIKPPTQLIKQAPNAMKILVRVRLFEHSSQALNSLYSKIIFKWARNDCKAS